LLVENKVLENIDLKKELFSCLKCDQFYEVENTKDISMFSAATELFFTGEGIGIGQDDISEYITPLTVLKRNTPSPLISIFDAKEPTLNFNHIYFFSYRGKHMTLVREDSLVQIFENGTLLATFKRSRK